MGFSASAVHRQGIHERWEHQHHVLYPLDGSKKGPAFRCHMLIRVTSYHGSGVGALGCPCGHVGGPGRGARWGEVSSESIRWNSKQGATMARRIDSERPARCVLCVREAPNSADDTPLLTAQGHPEADRIFVQQQPLHTLLPRNAKVELLKTAAAGVHDLASQLAQLHSHAKDLAATPAQSHLPLPSCPTVPFDTLARLDALAASVTLAASHASAVTAATEVALLHAEP